MATATALPPELPPTDKPFVPYETAPCGVFVECELCIGLSDSCLHYNKEGIPHAELIQVGLSFNDRSGGFNFLHYSGSIWADKAIQDLRRARR